MECTRKNAHTKLFIIPGGVLFIVIDFRNRSEFATMVEVLVHNGHIIMLPLVLSYGIAVRFMFICPLDKSIGRYSDRETAGHDRMADRGWHYFMAALIAT